VIPWLDKRTPFPPVSRALAEPNGLLAAGGDLSPARLVDAYRHGIFPWYSQDQPILWWSPDPRMVVFPAEFSPRRSLLKVLRNRAYEVRCDTAFEKVMRACAATPREGQDGTWITDEIVRGYSDLHEAGHAHSVETWVEGELVGGLYGVNLGTAFYGESMFSHATDASKIAFAHLAGFLHDAGCGIIDCQMKTSHLASLGAREIPRTRFASLLALHVPRPPITGWSILSRRWHPTSAA
jgi:leucyl/phenylalanyl-tRNA---protein transferase